MLGKLLKHEYRATARVFLPFYAAMIVVAIVTRILDVFSEGMYERSPNYGGVPQGISLAVTITLIAAACVVSLILTIQRFNKNMLGDEGYLMFTLPVSTDSLIFSKLIVSVTWVLASIVLALAALSIAIPEFAYDVNDFLTDVIDVLFRRGAQETIGAIIAIIAVLVSMACYALSIYAANALAMLFSRRRGLAGFGFWIAISIVAQVVTVAAVRIALDSGMLRWIDRASAGMQNMISSLLVLGYCLVGGAVLYVITRYMLKKKLNLE